MKIWDDSKNKIYNYKKDQTFKQQLEVKTLTKR